MKEFSINHLDSPEIEEWLAYEETLSPAVLRADGDCECTQCGFEYRQHPFTSDVDIDGLPFLHLLCDGYIVKL